MSENTQPIPPAPAAEGESAPAPKKLTKKELRMLERQKKQSEAVVEEEHPELYGFAPLVQSQGHTDKVWLNLNDYEKHINEKVLVRGRVQDIKGKGKCSFIVLRQGYNTIQCVAFQSEEIPKGMIKFMSKTNKESVVDITGTISPVDQPINCASISNFELKVNTFHIISNSAPELPFQIEDAIRADSVQQQPKAEEAAPEPAPEPAPVDDKSKPLPTVNPDTKLDYRWIDLRIPYNQAIFRVQSGVGMLFRSFLYEQNFVEIHTPKLQGGASEGGADVFKLDYFGSPACLAQSPQLFKQMTAACSDFGRVFEIGPVFRAENSNTQRHLCEFTGLDLEMTINEHYHECMDMLGDLFVYIFDGLNAKFSKEIEVIRKQFPAEPLEYPKKTVRLTFKEGYELLKEAGLEIDPHGDLPTEGEKLLGKIVKEKYHTDFYMLDKFPVEARPFYTMPDSEDNRYSNSFDFFIRGQEVLSGAQRVHDYALLVKQIESKGIPLDTLTSYTNSFKHGANPHAGAGIGLERVVMLFLGLNNVRRCSLFPRDPKRLCP